VIVPPGVHRWTGPEPDLVEAGPAPRTSTGSSRFPRRATPRRSSPAASPQARSRPGAPTASGRARLAGARGEGLRLVVVVLEGRHRRGDERDLLEVPVRRLQEISLVPGAEPGVVVARAEGRVVERRRQ